jgi:outer membrane murein-binding lipoprotein Lpp
MTERDSDIEFDFFDEPETEEASERVRTPRRPPPGGPRRPVRPPQGLIPMLRLAGLIAFLILAVVLVVVGVRGCASSGKHAKYAGYIQDVREKIATRSDQVGKDLNAALSATGIKETDLEGKIKGLAAQEQQVVATAVQMNPPGPLRVEHDHLIEVLKLRSSGLSRLADAFHQTATANARNSTISGRLIADQARLLVASDVNWDFYFKEPTQLELRNQNITDIGAVPDSNMIPNPELASTQAMTQVWLRVHGAATGGGTTTGNHGSALVSVTALPDGKRLNPGGAASDNAITASTDLAFRVAVQDSGDFQEFNVTVTLTIQKSPKSIVKRLKIPVINAGETKTVTFTNIDINGLFGLPTTVKVDIEPVPGEKTTTNNSSEYKVIFSLGG